MQAMAEGRRGRWTTATGREENIAAAMNNSEKVRWLYYLLVCLFVFVSHMQAMAEGQRRGGRRRDERRTCKSQKKVRWLYYLSVVVGFSVFVVSHMLAMAEGQRRGGWW